MLGEVKTGIGDIAQDIRFSGEKWMAMCMPSLQII